MMEEGITLVLRKHHVITIGTLVFLIATGCGAPGFNFDVTADIRGYTPPQHPGPEYFAGACAALHDVGPGAFMLIPGDLDPPNRVRATLDSILGPDYVMYPVIGNHEIERPADIAYLREYNAGGKSLPGIVKSGPPGAVETCYSFDYGDAHFAVINQYYDGTKDNGGSGDIVPALYDWLAADLAATNKRHIFVAGHEPIVSAPDLSNGRVRHRGDSLDQYPENNYRFWSLLHKNHVVAYLCGHTHNASVIKINGVWQIDCGHARGQGDPGTPSTFIKFYVAPDQVRCVFYRAGEAGYAPVYEERLR